MMRWPALARSLTIGGSRGWWLVLAVALLAACGRGTEEPALVVMGPGTFYAPAALTIPAGSTVIWHNQGRLVHTVTAGAELRASSFQLASGLPAGAEPFDSGDLFAGHTWAQTFDTPGQYVYYCRYHVDEQMIATLIVEAPR